MVGCSTDLDGVATQVFQYAGQVSVYLVLNVLGPQERLPALSGEDDVDDEMGERLGHAHITS